MRDSSVEIPVIRAATKVKLVERMTYHAYFDSKTVSVFLMVRFIAICFLPTNCSRRLPFAFTVIELHVAFESL